MSTDRILDISQRAYAIWEQAGCPAGTALDNWLQAEAELSKSAVAKEADIKSAATPKASTNRRPKRKTKPETLGALAD
jgi:hypothetical protein